MSKTTYFQWIKDWKIKAEEEKEKEIILKEKFIEPVNQIKDEIKQELDEIKKELEKLKQKFKNEENLFSFERNNLMQTFIKIEEWIWIQFLRTCKKYGFKTQDAISQPCLDFYQKFD